MYSLGGLLYFMMTKKSPAGLIDIKDNYLYNRLAGFSDKFESLFHKDIY